MPKGHRHVLPQVRSPPLIMVGSTHFALGPTTMRGGEAVPQDTYPLLGYCISVLLDLIVISKVKQGIVESTLVSPIRSQILGQFGN